MADYYPLIARAIAGLDPSAPGESRRALYERARSALIAQLRSVQPPLDESEITRERLSLEEAVRKVESEAAQRARDASRPGGPALRERRCLPPRQRPADRPSRRALRSIPRGRAPPRRRPRATPARRSAATTSAPPAQSPPRQPPAPRPQPPQLPMQDPVSAADPRTDGRAAPPRCRRRRCRRPPGMRGFRDIAADADDLGRAAATANRNARKTYANVPSPSPEFDRIEPGMENRGADPEAPYSYDDRWRRRTATRRSRRSRAAPAAARGSAAQRRRRREAHPRAGGVSVQERDRDRHRAGAGRYRHRLLPLGVDHGERPVQVVTDDGSAEGCVVRAAVEAEDPRPRRPAVVVRYGGAGGAARGAV